MDVAPKRLTISPTEGEQVQIGPGLGVVFKIEGHETGGAFSVVEHPIEPRTLVIPHVHEREDEFSYRRRRHAHPFKVGDRRTDRERGQVLAISASRWVHSSVWARTC